MKTDVNNKTATPAVGTLNNVPNVNNSPIQIKVIILACELLVHPSLNLGTKA